MDDRVGSFGELEPKSKYTYFHHVILPLGNKPRRIIMQKFT
jgi:hypothetical protein